MVVESQKASTSEPSKRSTWDQGNAIYRNLSFYIWPVILLGRKRQVEFSDLDPANHSDRAQILGQQLGKCYTDIGCSFQQALLCCFRWEIVKTVLIYFTYVVVANSCRTILLGEIVKELGNQRTTTTTRFTNISEIVGTNATIDTSYATIDDSDASKITRVIYSTTGYLLICFLVGPLINLRFVWSDHTGLRCRVAASQLIYEKSLRLNQQALGSSNVGQIVNLLSNDVARLEPMSGAIATLSVTPIYVAVTLVIFVTIFGIYPALACCASILLYALLQSAITRKFSAYRARIAACTDARVRLIHEYLTSIEAVKMNSWESQVEFNIEQVRRKEMTMIGVSRIFRTFFGGFMLSANVLFTLVAILVKVYLDGFPDPAELFMALELIRGLRAGLAVFAPDALSNFADFVVACRRIDKFLQRPEMVQTDECLPNLMNSSYHNNTITELDQTTSLRLSNIIASWPSGDIGNSSPILRDLSLTVRRNHLLMITGRVGSGKTSLLLALLSELPLSSGHVQVNGQLSYAPQEAWIFPGSLKENILFGSQLDDKRYAQVVKVCALKRDLELLPDGDSSMLGERGVSLSGGQRARVNLARALYRQADIYVLDDPLSAVDVPVARHIFRFAILEFLKDKTVVLATHQVQFLHHADQVLVVDKNLAPVCGTPLELAKSKQLESMGFDLTTFKSSAKHQDNFYKVEPTTDQTPSEADQSIAKEVRAKSISSPDGTAANAADSEQPKVRFSSPTIYYMSNATNALGATILVILITCSELLLQIFDYFLSLWAELSRSRQVGDSQQIESNLLYGFSRNQLTTIICSLAVVAIVGSIIRVGAFYRAATRASKKIHRRLVRSVIHSPLQFFDSNPIGAIINRFSRDIGYLDEFVPLSMCDLMVIHTIVAVGGIILIVALDPIQNLLPNLILMICIYFSCKLVAKTAIRLRILDNESKSPLYSHLSSSLAGLPTIRIFKAQQLCRRQFSDFQDTNTSACFSYLSAVSIFETFLSLPVFLFLAVETILAVLECLKLQEAGHIGLLLIKTLFLQMSTVWCGRLLLQLGGHLSSVQRVDEYSHLEPEPSRDTQLDCPIHTGKIEFKQVSLRYTSGGAPILRNLSFIINPGERVGIVGRTGAGKSSIIATIMRLYPFEGSILVDDCDSQQMSLQHLRGSISVIAQNPVLFAGSLRINLDPTSSYEDWQLQAALDAVQLQDTFGLDYELQASGRNISVGQRQLLCLARASLRRSKILVMDEATASTDNETDALVRRVVTQQFVGCTQLVVAHRLQTVIDSDRVMVLDAGQIREFAPPWELAEDKKSLFSQMIDSGQPEQVQATRKLLDQKRKQLKK